MYSPDTLTPENPTWHAAVTAWLPTQPMYDVTV